jgi:4-alpha-glucanotransferase
MGADIPSRASRPIPFRASGVLLHVTSLPGKYGIGDLGPEAYAFVDLLGRAKQSYWQILPLSPPGEGNSPYQAYSAFAGNPGVISPEALYRDGLVTRAELREWQRKAADRVDFAAVESKWGLLARAMHRMAGEKTAHGRMRAAFARFSAENAEWLEDYALFMAIKDQGSGPWQAWPKSLVLRKTAALSEAKRELSNDVALHRFGQFVFFRQLHALRAHARSRGVRIIGDLPIFVSGDSADVWARPELFLLDRHRRPRVVAGVPPDLFSKTGQRWGTPLYDWRAMKREEYRWWARRARAALAQADLVRLDHFRGFAAYWEIPARRPTAQHGRWVKGPGRELFDTLRAALGALPFIAEDLGVITPDVEALRDELGLPGMRVLQFAFGGADDGSNPHLPHNYPRNAVAYTGTHDNDTSAGWYAKLRREERARVRESAGARDGDDVAWSLMRLGWSSVADLAIAPVQDVLGLGSRARMNVPGKSRGNWGWRVEAGAMTDEAWGRLAELTCRYARARPQQPVRATRPVAVAAEAESRRS